MDADLTNVSSESHETYEEDVIIERYLTIPLYLSIKELKYKLYQECQIIFLGTIINSDQFLDIMLFLCLKQSYYKISHN